MHLLYCTRICDEICYRNCKIGDPLHEDNHIQVMSGDLFYDNQGDDWADHLEYRFCDITYIKVMTKKEARLAHREIQRGDLRDSDPEGSDPGIYLREPSEFYSMGYVTLFLKVKCSLYFIPAVSVSF